MCALQERSLIVLASISPQYTGSYPRARRYLGSQRAFGGLPSYTMGLYVPGDVMLWRGAQIVPVSVRHVLSLGDGLEKLVIGVRLHENMGDGKEYT